jgi:hypothetical protein
MNEYIHLIMNMLTSDKKCVLVWSIAIGGMFVYYCITKNTKSHKNKYNTPSNNIPSNNTPSNNIPSNNTPSNNTPSNNTPSTGIHIKQLTKKHIVIDSIPNQQYIKVKSPSNYMDQVDDKIPVLYDINTSPKTHVKDLDDTQHILKILKDLETNNQVTSDIHYVQDTYVGNDDSEKYNQSDDPIILMAMTN